MNVRKNIIVVPLGIMAAVMLPGLSQARTFGDFVGTWEGTISSETYGYTNSITLAIFADGSYEVTPRQHLVSILYPGTEECWYEAATDRLIFRYLYSILEGNIYSYTTVPFKVAAFTGDTLELHYMQDGGSPLPNVRKLTLARVETPPPVVPDGGTVSDINGFTNLTINIENSAIVSLTNSTSVTNQEYVYVVTDEDDIVAAFFEGGQISFYQAPPGVWRIYGIGYTGTLISEYTLVQYLTSTRNNTDVSDNFIRVIVENEGTSNELRMQELHLVDQQQTGPGISALIPVGWTCRLEAASAPTAQFWDPVLGGLIGNGETQRYAVPESEFAWGQRFFRLVKE